MKYPFPIITSIDDVESHRASGLIHEAFRCWERKNGTIVYDYSYMDNHVFPPIGANPFAAMARELRGLTFDAGSGRLLSRPYHKFFNAGEREEVLIPRLPFADAHVVLDKLDGSMIHAFLTPVGDLVFATRWGVTSIAKQALQWYGAEPHGHDGLAAIRDLVRTGHTPIFEWTSPDNIIVVRHEVPALTLTAIRHRESGAYMPFEDLSAKATAFGVRLVGTGSALDDWPSFVARVTNEVEGEGYVVRFADGHMLKVKNAVYARVHKFKANLSQDKDAAEIVMSGALDDMLPHLTDFERQKLDDYRNRLMVRVAEHSERIDAVVAKAMAEITATDPRERQKLFWTIFAAPLRQPMATFVTEVWTGKTTALQSVTAGILKNVVTLARFDAIAAALDLPRLGYQFESDP